MTGKNFPLMIFGKFLNAQMFPQIRALSMIFLHGNTFARLTKISLVMRDHQSRKHGLKLMQWIRSPLLLKRLPMYMAAFYHIKDINRFLAVLPTQLACDAMPWESH